MAILRGMIKKNVLQSNDLKYLKLTSSRIFLMLFCQFNTKYNHKPVMYKVTIQRNLDMIFCFSEKIKLHRVKKSTIPKSMTCLQCRLLKYFKWTETKTFAVGSPKSIRTNLNICI